MTGQTDVENGMFSILYRRTCFLFILLDTRLLIDFLGTFRFFAIPMSNSTYFWKDDRHGK